jgi:citrate synthase
MNNKGLEGVTVAESSISSIVGTTLTYRGYKIEDLANHATFEEVIYLLWYDKLPNQTELQTFKKELLKSMELPKEILALISSLPKGANTMEILRTAVSMLSIYEEQKEPTLESAIRLQAKISTIVAAISRIQEGKEPVGPKEEFGYAKNFYYMITGVFPTSIQEEAMDKALILHADHEFNASTFSARTTVATLSDLYSGVVSAIGTLKGPLHGGANEQVMKMLNDVGTIENVDKYIENAFSKKQKIMGIGHRVYKDGDPRAFILKEMARKLTNETGKTELFDISEKIEKIVEREKGLKPNVDFYSASVYASLGIKINLYTPIFAVSRSAGWIAHIMEQHQNNRLIRPRAEYIGKTSEKYLPMEERK